MEWDDGVEWDGMGRNRNGWEEIGWDGMRRGGMGWEGIGWDGVGWDGMEWDGPLWMGRKKDERGMEGLNFGWGTGRDGAKGG